MNEYLLRHDVVGAMREVLNSLGKGPRLTDVEIELMASAALDAIAKALEPPVKAAVARPFPLAELHDDLVNGLSGWPGLKLQRHMAVELDQDVPVSTGYLPIVVTKGTRCTYLGFRLGEDETAIVTFSDDRPGGLSVAQVPLDAVRAL